MDTRKPYTDKAMKNHAETYFGFMKLLKFGIGLVVVVLLGLAIFAA